MADTRGFQAENRIVFESVETGYEHGLEQTVLSGPGLQLLNPSHRDSYQSRMADTDPVVSELFQSNIRWRPADLRKAATEEEQKELRDWFLASGRTYGLLEGGDSSILLPLEELPQPFGTVLKKLAEFGQESGIFFPADIVLLYQGKSWLLPAGAQALVRMWQLPDDVQAQLVESVPDHKKEGFFTADCFLSITTVPWRLEVTHGPRGYRNAILETGLLMAQTMQALMQARLQVTVTTDFVDTTVDDILGQDGVERFSTALIAVSFSPADASFDGTHNS